MHVCVLYTADKSFFVDWLFFLPTTSTTTARTYNTATRLVGLIIFLFNKRQQARVCYDVQFPLNVLTIYYN